jgi:predicted  nucleic acid-binding Zn-ribbon protein
MNDIDMLFSSLKQQIDKLKIAVDKCHIPSIYVHTYKIASLAKSVEYMNLSENQKKVVNKLDESALKQFERLSKGRCSCGISRDI